MNIQRMKALFLYDWAVEKRRMTLAFGTLVLIYMLLCWYLCTYSSKSFFGTNMDELATSLNAMCKIFFAIAGFCSVFVITPILHHKFTQPQQATAYLTLPGTTAEKYWVMLSEYVLGFLAVFVLYTLCFYATNGIGWLFNNATVSYDGAPAVSVWWKHDLIPFSLTNLPSAQELAQGMFGEKISGATDIEAACVRLICSILVAVPFAALFQLGLYLVLNMFFRTYGQLKSIGSMIVLQMVFNLLASLVVAGIADYYHSLVDQYDTHEVIVFWVNVCSVLLWLVPLLTVAIYWYLYRLMAKKQAK